MYLVAGVSGHVGGAAARALLDEGQPVTVLVRSADRGQVWRERGAQVAVGSLDDAAGLASILEGKHGAFLLVPPNMAARDLIADRQVVIEAMEKAVHESQIPHVVFLSSVGAQYASGTGPILTTRRGEHAMRSCARNVTILRPASFLENWIGAIAVAKETGMLPSFFAPRRHMPMIATRDIGEVAAESLVEPAHGVSIKELAGPDDYTPEDISNALGRVLGKSVTPQFVLGDEVLPTLVKFGVPEPAAKLLAEMYASANNGMLSYEGQGAEFLRGRTTPEQFFRSLEV